MNFEPFFKQYEALVEQVESAFENVKSQYPDCVQCKVGCSDCCHALFDLTLIEALYIKHQFDLKFADETRRELIGRANEADRKTIRLKRQAQKEHLEGKTEHRILEEMASKRVRCALLDDDNRCAMYEARPLTCRLYGIPTVIGGKGHCCGLSGFEAGQAYPTVKLDAIYARLQALSHELAQTIQSRYPQLGDMLVPLSMALLTDYTAEYLGVKTGQDKARKE